MSSDTTAPAPTGPPARPPRVFLSYAREDEAHREAVTGFWLFLIRQGVEAHLDLEERERPRDWEEWARRQIRDADFVLVIASPAYKHAAEDNPPAGDDGWQPGMEAGLIRNAVIRDRTAALAKFLPVLLPGRTVAQIPAWLSPHTATHYTVTDYTVTGAETLLRYLTAYCGGFEPGVRLE